MPQVTILASILFVIMIPDNEREVKEKNRYFAYSVEVVDRIRGQRENAKIL